MTHVEPCSACFDVRTASLDGVSVIEGVVSPANLSIVSGPAEMTCVEGYKVTAYALVVLNSG